MAKPSYQKSSGVSGSEQAPLVDPQQAQQQRRRSRYDRNNTIPIVGITLCLIVLVGVGVLVVLSAAKRARINENQPSVAQQQINLLNEKKTNAVSGCESTIIALRHCEKIESNFLDHHYKDDHCSYLGFERSLFLSTLFGDHKTRWPTPSRLYGMSQARPDSKHKHSRQVETLTPLSQKSHVDVDLRFTMGQETDLADDFFTNLTSGELCGRVSVISWKHSEMPSLAMALGCGADEGCPDYYPANNFDQVWQIKFVYDPPVSIILKEEKGSLRKLKKKKSSSGKWAVFGYVTQQDFDPLRFSYESGDYPKGGTKSGGRWYKFLDKAGS